MYQDFDLKTKFNVSVGGKLVVSQAGRLALINPVSSKSIYLFQTDTGDYTNASNISDVLWISNFKLLPRNSTRLDSIFLVANPGRLQPLQLRLGGCISR